MGLMRAVPLAAFALMLALIALTVATVSGLQPVHDAFLRIRGEVFGLQVLDRDGRPLAQSGGGDWNRYDTRPLYEIPEFLRTAFIVSEDKRFYRHAGVDWMARMAAVGQNLAAGRAVRGASTISEQVVRIVNPRPRTIWARWLEGFEAAALERRVGKSAIFEFYLNQVPYASDRRGVVQAARRYFNRSLDTLSRKEMLALAVLVRAPSRLDLYRNPEGVLPAVERLADLMVGQGILGGSEKARILAQSLVLEKPAETPEAVHFANYVLTRPELSAETDGRLRTTLDGALQRKVQALLDTRLSALAGRKVHNGAVLVVDHSDNEVLAWAVAHSRDFDHPGSFIDAVTTPRQPGSALKPFVYALALERGWTAATLIDDAPLSEWVGSGLHRYHNYSRVFYGPVTLRQALGNSLNIPALKALQFVGGDDYLRRLRNLGFQSLGRHPDFYGDGIALGNGEVTLLELVRAYAALAAHGVYRPLKVMAGLPPATAPRRVVSREAADLVANILSDPDARLLEFGRSSVLNLPLQTAVKTGTSSDYRDAWAVGFDHRHVVGVWLGNLDQAPTAGLTGASGPALLLRAVFAELNRFRETAALSLSPSLNARQVCLETRRLRQSGETCEARTEWFISGTEPEGAAEAEGAGGSAVRTPWLRQPGEGLHMALDPRFPPEKQAFEFIVEELEPGDRVRWQLDGVSVGVSEGGRFPWILVRGSHRLEAEVVRGPSTIVRLGPVAFLVK